jgi:amino acid transporter
MSGLKRDISRFELLATSLCCMIGSGWLFSAYYAAQLAGPAAIVSWIIGGGMVLLIALVFSELSTMLPFAGGLARYTQFSHGAMTSFILSWLAWLSAMSVAPTEVQAILQYAAHFYPWLIVTTHHVAALTAKGFAVATVFLFIFSSLNLIGVKALMRYNAVMSIWKLLIPGMTVIALIFFSSFHMEAFTIKGFAPYGWHGILSALPAAVVFSFLGFREATSMAGETTDPKRAMPIAVIGSVVLCTFLYVAIQIAFTGSIKPEYINQGWQHLHFFSDSGPFAGLAASLGLMWLAKVIYVDALISPSGTGLIYTATTARMNFAMSKNHSIPEYFMQLNRYGVPMRAVLFNMVVGLLLFIPFPGWQNLVKFQSSAILLAYAAGPVCLLALRDQVPDLERPFKLRYPDIFCFMSLYVCNLLTYWSGWPIVSSLILFVVFGLILFLLYHHISKASWNGLNARQASWILPYFLGLSLISYLGDPRFGGRGYISFGWDFLLIAFFSLIIMIWAYRVRFTQSETVRSIELSQQEDPDAVVPI